MMYDISIVKSEAAGDSLSSQRLRPVSASRCYGRSTYIQFYQFSDNAKYAWRHDCASRGDEAYRGAGAQARHSRNVGS